VVANNGEHTALVRRVGRGLIRLIAVLLHAVTGVVAFGAGLVVEPIVWLPLLAVWLVALVLIIRRWTQAIVVLTIAVGYAAGLLFSLFLADQSGLTGA
jgi:hypothetical protein